MSEHLHETFIPGCFRCDLSLDEVGDDGRVVIRAGDLRALAAAREENGRLRESRDRVIAAALEADIGCYNSVPVLSADGIDQEWENCGACSSCVLRAALAREATDADR